MNISSLENWLTGLDNTTSKFRKFFWNRLLAPVKFVIEILCWIKIWRKIVLPALIENDKIFEFFEKNEFVYRKWFKLSKFEKWDVVPIDNPYYAEIKDSEKLRQSIRKEYIDTFISVIETYSPFDLQNYISLQCIVDYKPINGSVIRIYNIAIQYWRYPVIIKSFWSMLVWWIIIGGLWCAISVIKYQIIG